MNIRPMASFAIRLLSTSTYRNAALRTCLASPTTIQPLSSSLRINAAPIRTLHSSINFSSKLAGTALQIKKRPSRKKVVKPQENTEGFYNVVAYATAEEYDLEGLHTALTKQDLYQTKKFYSVGSSESDGDVLHMCAKYQVDNESHELFFFREGSVVLWNCSEEETGHLLRELREFEVNPYEHVDIVEECDSMSYKYTDAQQAQLKNGNFFIQKGELGDLDRYTFSNAMMSSVKLGIWEAALDRYVNSIAFLTDDLKSGRQIKMSRSAVLRKIGELFALKHMLNLRSDLLGTPDFYWDHDNLERLFLQATGYFSVQRRTKVGGDWVHGYIDRI